MRARSKGMRSRKEMEERVRGQSDFSAWDKDDKLIIDKGKLVQE